MYPLVARRRFVDEGVAASATKIGKEKPTSELNTAKTMLPIYINAQPLA